jgi:hypothetical protein
MRRFFLLVIFSGLRLTPFAQITHADFQQLIPDLKKEDWKPVYKKSGALLTANANDSSEMHAMMVYIHLFSGAGLVSEGKMSYKKLKEEVVPLVGQNILMAAHPFNKKEGSLNSTSLSKEGKEWKAFSAAANQSGTNILCFENFSLIQAPLPFKEKTFIRCGGILKSIEFNPNESNVWIMRLNVESAFVRSAE